MVTPKCYSSKTRNLINIQEFQSVTACSQILPYVHEGMGKNLGISKEVLLMVA
ncbi:MAG: hypothetical protein JETT_1957 [Candidatus Jettenia ecosi]|uniref:Uncharacterized protein n=1 Tax=Candidatus Jettenia ecosi TaxID=2494326 RepID=A0A533QAX2_9BACT|nr:MAG: hypothetical protein JETT_1957 [Candidatus Jettenia ecosi]